MAVYVGHSRGFDPGWMRFVARDSPLRDYPSDFELIDISTLSGTYTVIYDEFRAYLRAITDPDA